MTFSDISDYLSFLSIERRSESLLVLPLSFYETSFPSSLGSNTSVRLNRRGVGETTPHFFLTLCQLHYTLTPVEVSKPPGKRCTFEIYFTRFHDRRKVPGRTNHFRSKVEPQHLTETRTVWNRYRTSRTLEDVILYSDPVLTTMTILIISLVQ